MKKILILVEKMNESKKKLVEYLSKNLTSRAEVVVGNFSDLCFEIEGENSKIDISGEKISNFDLIVFRHVPKELLQVAETTAIILDFLKIKYFDSAYGKIGRTTSKLASISKFSLAGLPVMPSFFCWRNKIKEKRDYIISKFGFPLVAKKITGRRGKGVFLLKNRKDFDLLDKTDPDDQFLLQSFYPTDEEYRLLVLGDRVRVWERKSRTSETEFRQNVDLGAKEEFLDISQLPKEMEEIAVSAAKVLNYEITGVDILVDKNKKVWLLEANREPAFTYDPKISPELFQIAAFFAEQIEIDD